MNVYLKGNYKSFIKLDVFKTKKKTNRVSLKVTDSILVLRQRSI